MRALDLDLRELSPPADEPRRPSPKDLADCARAADAELVKTGRRHVAPYALLAPLDEIPLFAMSASDLDWYELNPRVAQIVARIDGVSTLRELLETAGMPINWGVRENRRPRQARRRPVLKPHVALPPELQQRSPERG